MSALDAISETAWHCQHCGAWNTWPERWHGPRMCGLCGATEDQGYTGDGVTIRRVQLRNGDYAVCLDGRMVHLSGDVCTMLWNTLKGVAGVTLQTLEPVETTMLPSWRTLNCSETKRV